ncbi:hypothetical protein DRQ33_04985, partial [bacterium]
HNNELEIRLANARSGKAKDLFELAVQYARMTSFSQADSLFLQAVEKSPDDAALLIAVGKYFEIYRKRPEQARKLYKRASSLETELRDRAFYLWGYTFLRTRQVDKALHIWLTGCEKATSAEVWLDCINDIEKLNRPKQCQKILNTLNKKFPQYIQPLKKMLTLGIDDSTKIMKKIFQINPFDDVLAKYSSIYPVVMDYTHNDIVNKAKNSSGLEKALFGHYLLDNWHNQDEQKLGIIALSDIADTPDKILILAECLARRGLDEYAYKLAVNGYSNCQDEEWRVRAKLLAGKILNDMSNVGLDFMMPILFGGNEPDLLGGALSVLTDKNDVKYFGRNIKIAENKLFTQQKCIKLLESILSENPDDKYKVEIYRILHSIANSRHNYEEVIRLLRLRMKHNPSIEQQLELYLDILDIYRESESISSMIKVCEEVFDKYSACPELADYIDDISWKLYGCEDSEKRLFSRYFTKWLNDVESGKVALNNFMKLSIHYYNILSKSGRKDFVETYLKRILQFDPHNKFYKRLAKENAYVFGGREKLFRKYPFINEFLNEYADYIVWSGDLISKAKFYYEQATENEQDIPTLLLSAELEYRASHFEQAYKLYRQILKSKPGWRWLIIRTAELANSLEDTDYAVRLYNTLITLQPDQQDYVERLGDILEQSDNDADEIWNLLIYNNPMDKHSWGELSAVHWDYLRYEQGEQVIRQAKQFFGDEKIFAKELGALLDWQGQYDSAFQQYILALHTADYWEIDELKDWLKKLFRHSGKQKKLIPEIAEYVNSNLDAPAVLDVFIDLCMEISDTSTVVNKLRELGENSKSTAILNRVINYSYSLQRPAIAAAAYSRIAKIENEYEPLINAAGIYAENGNLSRALDIWQDVVEFKPEYRSQYATFLIDHSRYKDAIKIYQQLLEEDSLKVDYYSKLAKSYIELGNTKKAQEVLIDAIEMYKKLDESKYGYRIKELRVVLADTYRDGEPHSALSAYERLLNKYPTDYSILRRVWVFATQKNLTEKLINYYQNVAEESPKNYRWNIILYWLNRWERNMDKANYWLRKACDNEPQRVDFWQMRFDMAIVMENYSDAEKCINQLEKLGPDVDNLKIDYYLITDRPESAYKIISKPIRKQKVSAYEYSNVISDAISRGLFDKARELLSNWEKMDSDVMESNGYYNNRLRLYELEEHPDSAVRLIQNRTQSHSLSQSGSDWRIRRVINDFVDFVDRWHSLGKAIESCESDIAKLGYWDNILLQELYISGGAITSLAKLLHRNGEIESAMEYLYNAQEYDQLGKICSDLNPHSENLDNDIRIMFAVGRWYNGKQEYARRILNSIPEYNPGNSYTFADIANAYLKLGEFSSAEKFARLAISTQKYPDSRMVRTLIDIKLAQNDTVGALKLITEIPSDEEIPDLWRIDELFRLGKDNTAMEFIRQRWNYFDRKKVDDYYYYSYYDEGEYEQEEILLKYNKWNTIVERYLERANLTENDYGKNRLVIEAGEYALNFSPQRTIQILERYFGRHPDNSDAIQLLAKALLKTKEYNRVIELLETQNSPNADILLAEAYYGIGDTSAGNYIAKSFIENERDYYSFSKTIHFLVDNNQYELACEIGKKALKLWSGIPDIWLKCGMANMKCGNDTRGTELIKRCAFQHYDNTVSVR